MITLIAAIDNNYGLGANGDLLVKEPLDMQHFKRLTLGHVVVMGKTTWLSLPLRKQDPMLVRNTKGKIIKEIDMSTHALKGRQNVVLTFEKEEFVHAVNFNSIEDILALAKDMDVFIVGGGSIYKQFYQYADVIELTVFDMIDDEADVFFPIIYHEDFVIQDRYVLEREDTFDISFLTLVRREDE